MAKALATHDRGVGRHPLKQREIASYIAGEIGAGRLRPGDQLPVREALKQRFATTATTIQRAFDHLSAEGVITSLPRQGSFVAERPPCLYRVALVGTRRRGSDSWRGLDESLFMAGERLDGGAVDVELMDAFEHVEGRSHRHRQLVDDLLLGRLAGAVFAYNPFTLGEELLVELAALPCIAFMTGGSSSPLPRVDLANDGSLDHGLAELRRRGGTRLALITSTSVDPSYHTEVADLAQRLGFSVAPHHRQAADLGHPQWVGNITRLLLAASGSQRPDALLVQDDTLLPHVLAAIEASPLRLGRDLQLLAKCNLPSPIPADPRILRMGHDLEAGMGAILAHLDGQRRGARQPRTLMLPITYEWEQPD